MLRSANESKLFYGYYTLAACVVFLFLSNGLGYYSFAVFFKPISVGFNWDRTVTSIGFTMLFLVQAAISPFIGRFTDRYGPRNIMTLGSIITGLGLALLSLTSSLPSFYAAYAILGLGISAMGLVPVSVAISSWFSSGKIGLALGIAAVGIGMGGTIFPAIVGNFLIPDFGWRGAYILLAGTSVTVGVVLAQLVIRMKPQERNIESQGDNKLINTENTKGSPQHSEGWTVGAAVKTSTLWLIIGAFMMFIMGQVGTVQNLSYHLQDIGFTAAFAASILSIDGLGSAVGKFLFGLISDWIAPKYCATISFLLLAISTLMLLTLSPASNPVLPWAFAIIMGLGIGGWAPLSSMLTLQSFGRAEYGKIYGIYSLFHNISVAMSPLFFSYVYDTTGSYYLAYITALGLYTTAIVFALLLRPPRHRPLE